MCTVDTPPVLTYRELASMGYSRRAIKEAVYQGAIRSLRRGVYVREGTCHVVERSARHGGAPACVSAARHLALWVLDEDPRSHVWLRAHGRSYEHSDCDCIAHWDDGSAQDSFGMPSVPRILRQILICRGVEAFFVTLESARRQGAIDEGGLAWLMEATGPAARDAITFSRGDADSGLESLLRWRLRPHGLSVCTQVSVFAVGRVDFVIGDRLIVEVDGVDNHDGASHRHKDLVRDAHAAIWGYTTLRFDYAMVVHDWSTVESAILAATDSGIRLPEHKIG